MASTLAVAVSNSGVPTSALSSTMRRAMSLSLISCLEATIGPMTIALPARMKRIVRLDREVTEPAVPNNGFHNGAESIDQQLRARNGNQREHDERPPLTSNDLLDMFFA